MKGQLEVPIIGLLATITIVLGFLVVTKLLTSPLIYLFEYQQETEKADLILLSLLSSSEDGKSINQLIGENLIYGSPPDSQLSQIISEKLNRLVESKCYRLSTEDKTLAENPRCEPKKYEKEITLTLPYNTQKLTEKLKLVIN